MRTAIAKVVLACVVFAGFGSATSIPSGAQRPASPPAQNPPASKYKYAGVVRIVGQFADPGTSVQIVVFDAASNFTVCGDATVSLQTVQPGANSPVVAGYTAALYDIPQCVNPDDKYEFYVNGIWAAENPFQFSTQIPTYVNLTVPEIALKSNPEQSGVRLLWISGKVFDTFGRPAVPGTPVTAEAVGAPCKGSGKTENLYWQSKAPNATPVGINGFFWIAVEKTPACSNRPLMFNLTAPGITTPPVQVSVKTPQYGVAFNSPAIVIAPK
jgi:hypothetical protein